MINPRHAIIAGLYVFPALAVAVFLAVIGGGFAAAVGTVSATLLIIAGALTHHRMVKRQSKLPIGTAMPEQMDFRREVMRDARELTAFVLFPPPPPIRPQVQRAAFSSSELASDVRSMREMVGQIAEDLKAEAWMPKSPALRAAQEGVALAGPDAGGAGEPILTTAGEKVELASDQAQGAEENLPWVPDEDAPEVDPALMGDPFVMSVRGAIMAERMEVFIQPVVSLPSRRTRFFACDVRLYDDKGKAITSQQYEEVAERESLTSAIDTYLLARVVPMVRHCVRKNLNYLFFCAISSDSLADPEFVSDILRVHANDPRIASRMVFELPESHFRHLRKAQLAAMQKLVIAGFRFAADRMQSLKIDYETLSERYVRFLKVPAPLLLVDKQQAASDTDLSILRRTLDRIAIDLVVERVGDEATLKEMLDFGIDYGQGTLFGDPKAGNRETMAAVEAKAREEADIPLVEDVGEGARIIDMDGTAPAADKRKSKGAGDPPRNNIPPELAQAAIRNARRAVANGKKKDRGLIKEVNKDASAAQEPKLFSPDDAEADSIQAAAERVAAQAVAAEAMKRESA